MEIKNSSSSSEQSNKDFWVSCGRCGVDPGASFGLALVPGRDSPFSFSFCSERSKSSSSSDSNMVEDLRI